MSVDKNNKDLKFLRFKVQKALAEQGLIEEVDLDDDSIEIIETSRTATLKKVCIRDLNFKNKKLSIDTIWKINLERDIPGISTKGRTAEMALIILQKYETGGYRLNVCLIEMKSSLQPGRSIKNKKDGKDKDGKDKFKDNSLIEIGEKIKCSMNRMYMLMSLNNHQIPSKKVYSHYSEANIDIYFKGIIIFDRNELSPDFDVFNSTELSVITDDYKRILCKSLYEILNSHDRAGLVDILTILDEHDKIIIKFFPKKDNDSEEHRTIRLSDLL